MDNTDDNVDAARVPATRPEVVPDLGDVAEQLVAFGLPPARGVALERQAAEAVQIAGVAALELGLDGLRPHAVLADHPHQHAAAAR